MKRKRSRSKKRSRSRSRSRAKPFRVKRVLREEKKRAKTNFTSFFEKLLINTQSNPRSVYLAFSHQIVQRFVRKFAFVNARFGRRGTKISISLRGFKTYPKHAVSLPWSKIKCKSIRRNIKSSPCSIASNNTKIFYRRATDLRDYIMKLKTTISYAEHLTLFRYTFKMLNQSFVNSNREIKILHFKNR
jgi:hypothetical protein